MRKVIKIFAAAVFSLLLAAVLVPLGVGLALSFPAVQNTVGQRVTTYFSEKLGAEISFDRLEVRRLNRVEIEGLYFADTEGDTLLYVPHLEAPVEQLPLLGRPLTFGRVKLEKARMHIDRDSAGVVNIRRLVRKARAASRKKGTDFQLYINGITADGITFALTRADRAPREQGVDFSRFIVHDTDVDISRLAVEGSDLRIAIEDLSFTERTGWRVDRLRGELLVGRGSVSLAGVEIDSEGSELRFPRIAIEGSTWRSFRRFADSVRLDIAIENSRVGGEFLKFFVPAAERFEGLAAQGLTAPVRGRLGSLAGRVESARVGGGELALEFTSRGLPDLERAGFSGVVSRFSSTGEDLARLDERLAGVGSVDFSGSFTGSVESGFDAKGALTAADVALRVDGLGPLSGEFDVAATVGKTVRARAAGAIKNVTYRGRSVGDVSVDGEWSGGEFHASVDAPDPFDEWGLNGALSAFVQGSPEKFDATAELKNVLYITPRGTVATPRIGLEGIFSPEGKSVHVTSEFADADLGMSGGTAAATVNFKNPDALFAALVPGLQVAEEALVRAKFDAATREGEMDLAAQFVEYRGVLLTDARFEARQKNGSLTATLGARDMYSSALHIPLPRLAAEVVGDTTRLTLDGTNYLTVAGLSVGGISDSLHIDLDGFDLAALGGLTPKGTKVNGRIDVANKKHISARVSAKGVDAAVLEPFLGGVLTGTSGRANLEGRASGSIDEWRIDGGLELFNLSTTVGFTGARYAIDHARIGIENSRATLHPTVVRDRFGGEGELALEMDLGEKTTTLTASPHRLLAFDRSGSNAFGGRVFASGEVSITADRMGTTLRVDARTDEGTTIKLPLNGRSDAEFADFVTFAPPTDPQTDSVQTEIERRRRVYTRPRGGRRNPTEIDMTLRVTDDAEVGLTIDPRLGRGITARGDGIISLGVDPQSGEVSLTGDYTIRQGRFDFSMMDVLSKNFTIAPGSTIRWSGHPADAALDVRALYRVRTSLAPLLGEGSVLVSDRANVPVDCVLLLGGGLGEPSVGFDIEFPSADTDQRQIAQEAMNTEELKSMQFLSLLVTGNFASAGSIGAGTGASTEALASGSVGFDILTSQLGNLLSSDEYDVYFRYRPEDNFLTNRFDMGFAAGFAHDRLRLEIEGNYVDDRAAVSLGTQGRMGNLAGDVSLTWVIDAAGNLRLKVFSQTIDRLNETQGLQESGLGVYYRKDFDRMGDIFRRKMLNLPTENTKKLK